MGLTISGGGSSTPADGSITGAKLATAVKDGYGHGLAQAGVTVPQVAWQGNGNLTLTASRAILVRFVPSKDITATGISFVTGTAAGANDACDVGIYSAAGNRLASAGATVGKLNATAGVQTVTFTGSVALTGGTVYYAAFSAGTFGGAAAILRAASYLDANLTLLYGANIPQIDAAVFSTSHPLPSSVTITAPTSTTNVPIMAVLA